MILTPMLACVGVGMAKTGQAGAFYAAFPMAVHSMISESNKMLRCKNILNPPNPKQLKGAWVV